MILGLTQGSGYIHNIDHTSEMFTTRKVVGSHRKNMRLKLNFPICEPWCWNMNPNIYPINDPVM